VPRVNGQGREEQESGLESAMGEARTDFVVLKRRDSENLRRSLHWPPALTPDPSKSTGGSDNFAKRAEARGPFSGPDE